MMDAQTPFSYQCNACGRCCHNQVITLSPYDVLRLARAAHLSTTEAIARFTLRRGSLLRFESVGGCAALDGSRCTLHLGRPLACRLYPLGLESGPIADPGPHAFASKRSHRLERKGARVSFVRLEPAAGSAGVYGTASTVANFLNSQNVAPYLSGVERYRSLIPLMRAQIATLVDVDRIEPREFWRRAFHEAMRETDYDPNPLITAIFDTDAATGAELFDSEVELIDAHLHAIAGLIRKESNPASLASAAFLLAVSLGLAPAEVEMMPDQALG
ncbi:MAG TPA: YkgJ family cysteine cluster protein [Candidatus Binataceae bacterium]|nr:YkgJ family cysteine cluster protein [Candidatus Binataceae bacterium]